MVLANPKNKFIERIIDAARERKRQRLCHSTDSGGASQATKTCAALPPGLSLL